jgi:hypothetical protein
MKSKNHIYGFSFLIILLVIPILYSCNSRENSDQLNEQVAVVLAYPDDERVHSFDAHHTQFPLPARTAYKVLVHTRRFEQFIIAEMFLLSTLFNIS